MEQPRLTPQQAEAEMRRRGDELAITKEVLADSAIAKGETRQQSPDHGGTIRSAQDARLRPARAAPQRVHIGDRIAVLGIALPQSGVDLLGGVIGEDHQQRIAEPLGQRNARGRPCHLMDEFKMAYRQRHAPERIVLTQMGAAEQLAT